MALRFYVRRGTLGIIPPPANTNTTQFATTGFSIAQDEDESIQGYQGFGSLIKAQTVGGNLRQQSAGQAFVSGTAWFTAVTLKTPQIITGIKWIQTVQGVYTADTSNVVGLYTYSGGTLTRVAVSTDDGTIWKVAANTFTNKAFSATYSALPGLYVVGMLYHSSAQTTAPSIYGLTGFPFGLFASMDFTNSGKLSGTLAAQTALPSSQAMSGITASAQTLWVALY